MQKRSWLLIIILLVHFSISKGQSQISGKVIDSLGQPLPFVTLALLKSSDSTIIKGSVSNEQGVFIFQNILPGSYLLKTVMVGFKDRITGVYNIDSLSDLQVPDILLNNENTLGTVSIVAVKNPIEFKNGNIIVNIEDSPLAIGNSAYDLLSHLPGVVIDNDNISIQGKSGAKIFIDGRQQQQSGQQLMTLLRSINASSIEKIEILKNPPIKYDASGTAGIINIKTKKVKLYGFNGSVNVSGSQGKFGRSDLGLSLNYKRKKIVLFSNLDIDYSTYKAINMFEKKIAFDSVTTSLNQGDTVTLNNRSSYYKLGMDWYANSRNTIGFFIEGTLGSADFNHQGNNKLDNDLLGYNQVVYNSQRPNSWNYIDYNLNAEHTFDTAGTKLTFSADYSPNIDKYLGTAENKLYNNNTPLLPSKLNKSNNTLIFNLFSSKLDFEKIIKGVVTEAGIKYSNQKMESAYLFESLDPLTNLYISDTTYSNTFFYTEQVSAAYINLEKEYHKLNFQLGLRAEYTAITLENRTLSLDRNYFNLFPSASIEYHKSENSNFQLSYNRRLNRPGYNSYNPYKFFDNIFMSSQGNPLLMPEYSNSIDLTHNFKNSLSNSVSFSMVNNQIIGYTSQNDSTKETINLIGNLDKATYIGYSIFYKYNVLNGWTVTANAGAFYTGYSGYINNAYYKASTFSYSVFATSLFTLPKEIKIEINGQFFGPSLAGFYKMKSRGSVGAAITKSFFKEKLNIGIGIEDIFFTSGMRNEVDFENQHSTITHQEDSRRIKINLSYNFGKIKIEARDEISNDEEKNRRVH